MQDKTGPEHVVHGNRWGSVHGGYFSDANVAAPLVQIVEDVLRDAQPDVIVDLGGGTGFLLSELGARELGHAARLVNVDCSDAQLEVSEQTGITTVRASVEDFRRTDIASGNERVLFVMRSVLHYAGKDGLSPLLRHLRAQAKQGEYFIHQTASFENAVHAACLNALYEGMRTCKWYPSVSDLRCCLADAGWDPLSTAPAPALRLDSGELAERYALTRGDIAEIRADLIREFGPIDGVFQSLDEGFRAWLHYQLYTCRAAGPA